MTSEVTRWNEFVAFVAVSVFFVGSLAVILFLCVLYLATFMDGGENPYDTGRSRWRR